MRLLASFTTESDARRQTQALLWFRALDAKGGPVWGLELAANYETRAWSPVIVVDGSWSPIRMFKTRPLNRDIDELLSPPSPWLFESHGGDPITYGYVREYTWKAVIGEAPNKRYYRNKK